jgi:hypothetical protein
LVRVRFGSGRNKPLSLCKALIDRIIDRANIIETGTESYRFRSTLEKRRGKNPNATS